MKFNMQNLKKIILFLILLLVNISCDTYKSNISIKKSINEKLNVPFGTLVKLKIEIIDGNSMDRKGFQGTYLIRVLETNDSKLNKPFIIPFEDQTRKFPKNDFLLYEFIYGKEVENELSSDKIEEIKKNYVGKIFHVLAYESGCFGGNTKVSKYVKENLKPNLFMRQDTNFIFKNYIVIESKIDE